MDTPFEGIASKNPKIAESLRDASLEAWDLLVQLALERKAAFVVLSGDLYDGEERGVRAQLRFLRGLERMSAAGTSVFVIHGNHDPLSGWSGIKTWPERVTVFDSDQVGRVSVEWNGEICAQIYGISYPQREVKENLSLRFKREEGPGIHVALLHASVGAHTEHAAYSPCTVQDLARAGMDYWALGHIHRREVLHRGAPWIVYPGNLQGRSPKPSEQGEKGALVIPVRGGKIQEPEFVSLDRVRFESLSVVLPESGDLAQTKRVCREAGIEALKRAGGRGVWLRVQLTGRVQNLSRVRQPAFAQGLLEELREEFVDQEPWLWWDQIRVEAQGLWSREEILVRQDFTGDLVRKFDRLRADPEKARSLIESAAGKLGRSQSWDLETLIRRAEERVLDRLLLEEDA